MHFRRVTLSTLSIAIMMTASAVQAQTPASLTLELSRPKAAVSPTLYGLMTEEINYLYDGGLYAELVSNRTFRSDWSGILNWFLIEKGQASARLGRDQTGGPSSALSNSAKLEVTKADVNSPAGLLSEGYWGMAVRPNTRYKGSFFAKSTCAEAEIPKVRSAKKRVSDAGFLLTNRSMCGTLFFSLLFLTRLEDLIDLLLCDR